MPQQPGLFGPLDNKDAISSIETVSAGDARLVRVAFDSGADQLFDYALPDSFTAPLTTGQRVRVPFGRGNRLQLAFCVEFPDKSNFEHLKTVYEIVDPTPLLDRKMMELAHWIARYYC